MPKHSSNLLRTIIFGLATVVLLMIGYFMAPLVMFVIGHLLVSLRTDSDLINEQLYAQFPGYSEIQVLRVEKNETFLAQRITFQAQVDSIPRSSSCQGELLYQRGDPSFARLTWQSDKCIELSKIIAYARSNLRNTPFSNTPFSIDIDIPTHDRDKVIELLIYWVKSKRISLSDIRPVNIQEEVQSHLDSQ